MKTIEVKKLMTGNPVPELAEVSVRMDELGPGHWISVLNWKGFDYKPQVRFNIAYGEREIYLKYYVREAYVKAEKQGNNEMVCEDSCVEFFVSPENDGLYYNFEFNPIGTTLLGSGHGRSDSSRSEHRFIDGIRRLTTLGTTPFGEIKGDAEWTITVAIPLSSFYRHEIRELSGKTFRANFYKCGDKLSKPHFVTWNPVGTEKPDYHRPEFFGELRFV